VSKMRTAEGSGKREGFQLVYSVLLRGWPENDNRILHCGAGRLRTVARHVVNRRHEFMLGLRGASLQYVYKT